MKVWLYNRLSRDEDDELNSLTNQRKIIYEYAVTNGHEVVGESFDDNVSGMHFNSLYLQGCGQKEIARRLNAAGRKTPAQLRAERCGREVRHTHKTRDGQFLWTYASVKNVLVEEAYTGVLVNHRREYLGGKARGVSETDWLRHENFYPVIIEKTIW